MTTGKIDMTSLSSWLFLLVAIGAEVSGTIFMKLSDGFSKTMPSVLMFVFYGASLSALALAIKHIPVGVAYAIWSGLGTTLIVGISICVFNEIISTFKVISILFIIIGVIGLNLITVHH